jgi:N-glycosylase/DNA lyase
MRVMMQGLVSEYNKKKLTIKKRLKEFKSVWGESDKRIFSELSFCICTPQSKAAYCDRAISGLEKSGMLFKGNLRQIKAGLKAVRFPNNKAGYILESRKFFTTNGVIRIKDKIRKTFPGRANGSPGMSWGSGSRRRVIF